MIYCNCKPSGYIACRATHNKIYIIAFEYLPEKNYITLLYMLALYILPKLNKIKIIKQHYNVEVQLYIYLHTQSWGNSLLIDSFIEIN